MDVLLQHNFDKFYQAFNKVKCYKKNHENNPKDTHENPPEMAIPCPHCNKIFKHAYFVMKHLHKRHPEYLLIAYNEFIKSQEKDVNKIDQIANQEIEIKNVSAQNPNNTYLIKTPYDASNEFKKFIKCGQDDNFRLLQEKYDQLSKDVKDHLLICKEKKAISDFEHQVLIKQAEEMMNLRSTIQENLFQFNKSFTSQMQEQNAEWKMQFSHLKEEFLKEIKRLDHSVENYVDKMKMFQNLEAIENDLKYFSTPLTNKYKNMLTASSSSKRNHGHKNRALEAENPHKKARTKNPAKYNTINNKVMKTSFHQAIEENSSFLDEKLKSFGIPLNIERLSNEEFEKKMKLVNNEKEALALKNKNFLKVRQNVNSWANRLTLSRLRKLNNPKRVSFMEPESNKNSLESLSFSPNESNCQKMQTNKKNSLESVDQTEISDNSQKKKYQVEKCLSSGFVISNDAMLDNAFNMTCINEESQNHCDSSVSDPVYNSKCDKNCGDSENTGNKDIADLITLKISSPLPDKILENLDYASELESLNSWDSQI